MYRYMALVTDNIIRSTCMYMQSEEKQQRTAYIGLLPAFPL